MSNFVPLIALMFQIFRLMLVISFICVYIYIYIYIYIVYSMLLYIISNIKIYIEQIRWKIVERINMVHDTEVSVAGYREVVNEFLSFLIGDLLQ